MIKDTFYTFRDMMKELGRENTLQYKQGVKFDGLQDITRFYISICALAHMWLIKKPLTVTSLTDGKHMKNSLHYKGLAFDVRIKDKTIEQTNKFVNFLKFEFDKTLDIVLEKDHIHIEYQPK